jgi:hypothetical protein
LAAISAGQSEKKMKDIEITSDYWVGENYSNDGWTRLTLFHKRQNVEGQGSVSTPIATIDIVKHPGQDGCNSHSEIRFKVRNDIKRQGSEMVVDENAKTLRHVTDVVDNQILNTVVEKLKEATLATLPLSIYVCMEHVEKFETQGAFWAED